MTAFEEAWSLSIAYFALAIVQAVKTTNKDIVQLWSIEISQSLEREIRFSLTR